MRILHLIGDLEVFMPPGARYIGFVLLRPGLPLAFSLSCLRSTLA